MAHIAQIETAMPKIGTSGLFSVRLKRHHPICIRAHRPGPAAAFAGLGTPWQRVATHFCALCCVAFEPYCIVRRLLEPATGQVAGTDWQRTVE